jgi:predicted phosphate transport protein (TIGR00153 family)
MFVRSPFDAIQEHAEKVKECSWAFQQAMECYASARCDTFEDLRQEVSRFENEADAIMHRIRSNLSKGVMMPVKKSQLFQYLREQDSVMDSVKSSINWLSFRPDAGIPDYAGKDFFLLIDAVIEPIEELTVMVAEARIYFKNFSEKKRQKIKEIIFSIRQMGHEADKWEYALIKKIFKNEKDPTTLLHLVKLSQTIGNIADHAENTADMMGAMLAK